MLAQILTAHGEMIQRETLTTINDTPSTINAKELEIDEGFTIQLVLIK